MMEPTVEAVLFRVEEVTQRGTLPAGRYLFTVDREVMLDVDLREPMRPRDLKPLIAQMFSSAA